MKANLLYNYLVFALGHCCLQLLFCKISQAAGPARKIKIKARKEEVSWYSVAQFRHKHCWDQADVLERCGTQGQSENPLVFTFIHPKPQKCKFPIFSLKPQSSCSQKWDNWQIGTPTKICCRKTGQKRKSETFPNREMCKSFTAEDKDNICYVILTKYATQHSLLYHSYFSGVEPGSKLSQKFTILLSRQGYFPNEI